MYILAYVRCVRAAERLFFFVHSYKARREGGRGAKGTVCGKVLIESSRFSERDVFGRRMYIL